MGISPTQLLIILAIALVIFGAKRLRTLGSDLGSAVRGFKKSMGEGEEEQEKQLSSSTEKDAEFGSTSSSSKTENKSTSA